MPRTVVIVARDRRDVYASLRHNIVDDDLSRLLLDRRMGDRRRIRTPVPADRRRAERRQRRDVETALRSRGWALVRAEPAHMAGGDGGGSATEGSNPSRRSSRLWWWRVVIALSLLMATVGGGIMLWDKPLPFWVHGRNLLVVGILGLVISTIGAWIDRDRG